jgi:hypothetical protein
MVNGYMSFAHVVLWHRINVIRKDCNWMRHIRLCPLPMMLIYWVEMYIVKQSMKSPFDISTEVGLKTDAVIECFEGIHLSFVHNLFRHLWNYFQFVSSSHDMFRPQTVIIRCLIYIKTVTLYKMLTYSHYMSLWCFMFNLLNVYLILICLD